jgi:hypothetical protein
MRSEQMPSKYRTELTIGNIERGFVWAGVCFAIRTFHRSIWRSIRRWWMASLFRSFFMAFASYGSLWRV